MATDITSKPVPDYSYEVARRNLEDLDKFENQLSGTVTFRNDNVVRPLPVLVDEIESIIAEIPAQIARLGLEYPPIPYTSGLTLNSYTKTYNYLDALYIWGGALGTVTTGDFDETGWQPIQGDIQLRNDVTKGTSLIRDVKHVASVAALRLLSGEYDGQVVRLTNYYAGELKGGGDLVWNASSTAADDGGVTFAVTGVATGRWVRLLDGFVTPEMFGVLRAGNNDSAAMQKAIDYSALSGIEISIDYTDDGIMAYDLQAKNGAKLKGNRRVRIYKPQGVNANVIYNPNAASNIPVDDFYMESITIDAGDNGSEAYAKTGASFDGCRRFTAIDCRFTRATGYGLGMQAFDRGTGQLNGPQEDIRIVDCEFDNNGFTSLGGNTYDGLDIKKSIRCYIENIVCHNNADKGWDVRGQDLIVNGATSYLNGGDGFGMLGGYAIADGRVARMTADKIHSYGNLSGGNISITEVDSNPSNISRYMIGQIHCHDNNVDGLVFDESAGATTGKSRVLISNLITNNNGRHGLLNAIAGQFSCQISNFESEFNGGNGINNTGNGLNIINGFSTDNIGFGYAEASASLRNKLVNIDLTNNTAGSTSNVGVGGTVFINCAGVNASVDFESEPNARSNFLFKTRSGNLDPVIAVKGSDTNRGGIFQSKGSGNWSFATVDVMNVQFRVGHGGSGVTNFIEALGSTAVPSFRAVGASADIDILFTPKGIGKVRFGTLTASADAPVAGYIEVKDAGGTIRKLAVIN